MRSWRLAHDVERPGSSAGRSSRGSSRASEFSIGTSARSASSAHHRREELVEGRAGHDLDAGAQGRERGLVAERAPLALDRHPQAHGAGRICGRRRHRRRRRHTRLRPVRLASSRAASAARMSVSGSRERASSRVATPTETERPAYEGRGQLAHALGELEGLFAARAGGQMRTRRTPSARPRRSGATRSEWRRPRGPGPRRRRDGPAGRCGA